MTTGRNKLRFLTLCAKIAFKERVAGAPATCGILYEDTAFDQVVDIAAGGILRTLREFSPLGRGQLGLETIEKAIYDFLLPFVERFTGK